MSVLPVGYAHGIDGPLEVSRWCPKCQDLVIARDDHRCSWCDNETVPATERGPAPMATATETRTCKIEGCGNPSEDMAGPYGRLCLKHKTEARSARQSGGGTVSRLPTGEGYAARVRALLKPARALDLARQKLDAAGTNDSLKAEFDEASRRAQAVSNAENLERLEKATKALRRGAPRLDAARRKHGEVERDFKLALGAIARDFRAA